MITGCIVSEYVWDLNQTVTILRGRGGEDGEEDVKEMTDL